MKTRQILFSIFILFFINIIALSQMQLPHLKSHDGAMQLIVQGKPFLMLGGELGNSSASDSIYLKPFWKTFSSLNLNTILAPVYWELFEPEEGKFDYRLIHSLITNARRNKIKLVLLWFGTWKNSMSCYVPAWVKTDYKRFPRSVDKNGNQQEILTSFGKDILAADKNAFVQLMKYLKKIDSRDQTVIMIQVENEIGFLPNARDYHPLANEAFRESVPKQLIDKLTASKNELPPQILRLWDSTGYRTQGSWQDVFGKNVYADEVFTAWHYARFVDEIAAAGKAVYPLPMYVNAALPREGRLPGEYPSAGPIPHLMEIWQAGAPHIDMLCPDIYFSNFTHWCVAYDRAKNPLFIPEAKYSYQSSAQVFYAIGRHNALGFSPFSIESPNSGSDRLSKAYGLLGNISPLILDRVGTSRINGVLLDKEHPTDTLDFGEYRMIASFELNDRYAWQPPESDAQGGAIFLQISENEFIIAGSGAIVVFQSRNQNLTHAGILSIDDGKFENGKWIQGVRQNGDQSHQGRHTRLPYSSFEIHRMQLYQYP